MNDEFAINAGEIDVEGIKDAIRSSIERKKQQGGYTREEEQRLGAMFERPTPSDDDLFNDSIRDMAANAEIANNTYRISSHRPVIGRILTAARKLVNGEVKRYVDPSIGRQQEFNRDVVRALKSLDRHFAAKIESDGAIVGKKIEEGVDAKIKGLFTSLGKEAEDRAWLARFLERQVAGRDTPKPAYVNDSGAVLDYAAFSGEIAQTWARIGGRPSGASNIFDDAAITFAGRNRVLDIGCGSGYFLETMKDRGIGSYGVELDKGYATLCLRKGLEVISDNALTHLEMVDDNGLDGVFMSQVAEHMSIEHLNELILLCHKKLSPGCSLMIAVPNIQSMLVSTNLYYLDPTHRQHIHPEVLNFLLRSAGFTDLDARYYQPVPDEIKLRRIPTDDGLTGENREMIGTLNHNIDVMNDMLFGYRDYVVICKK